MTISELEKKANYIRDEVIRVAVANKAGHIAPSLSTVDILVALYYDVMQPFALRNASGEHYALRNGNAWENRDRFILSKGHGCYALYAILADLGILPKDEWELVGSMDRIKYPSNVLRGCVEYNPHWGLEASTGSLGHGLPMAVGMAYAAKLLKKDYRIFCMLGDGECQEGTTWESVDFACERDLDNLIIVVDNNKLRAIDKVPYNAHDIEDRFRAFGCHVFPVNGHDMMGLTSLLRQARREYMGMPTVIIANTIKGRGLVCMENQAKFHYRVPTEEELAQGRTYGKDN